MNCLSLLIQSAIHRSGTNNFRDRSMSSLSGSPHRRRMNIQRMIPPYIDSLFTSFCRQYISGQITLSPSDFISLPLIYKHLFDNFGFIKIDLFCNLFINIDSIRILNVILNDNIFDSLYKFLSQFATNKRRGAVSQKRRSSVLDSFSLNSMRQNNQLITKPNNKKNKNENDGSLSLTAIQFINVNEKYISCKQSVNKYQQNLTDIGWNIKYIESSLYINKQ